MDPVTIAVSLASIIVGALARHYWPAATPVAPGTTPAAPGTIPAPAVKHPLFDSIKDMLMHFLANPPTTPGTPNPALDAFLKLLASVLQGGSANVPAIPVPAVTK